MEERKNSKARIRTNNKWTNAHYDRINIAVPKGRKDAIQTAAAAAGQSVNAYINQALEERMGRETPTGAQAEGVVSVPMETAGSATEATETPQDGGEDGICIPVSVEAATEAVKEEGEGIHE